MTLETENFDWGKLVDQLYLLRREGPGGVLIGKVPYLTKIAERLVPDEGDQRRRLKISIELAIGDLEPESQEIALLWFGLHEDTRGLDKDEREIVAAERRFVSHGSFRAHHMRPLIDALGERLVARYDSLASASRSENDQPAKTRPKPTSTWPQSSLRERYVLSRRPPRHLFKWVRLLPGALVAVAIALVPAVLWEDLTRSDRLDPSKKVPPPGTVIDAATGEAAQRVNRQVNKQGAYISGGALFRACNLTTEDPCKYSPDEQPQVRDGDIVKFGIMLHNPNESPLPYTTVVMSRAAMGSSAPPYTFIQANLTIDWPENREASAGPIREELKLPSPVEGYASLAYIPGSTVLEDENSHFLSHLPDGIMEDGVALANVGSPASCFSCHKEYIRFIFFKARVGVISGR